jgi:hypothetical protein
MTDKQVMLTVVFSSCLRFFASVARLAGWKSKYCMSILKTVELMALDFHSALCFVSVE